MPPEEETDPFPVPAPEPAPTEKKKPGPEKGSEKAREAAQRAVATRRANAGYGPKSKGSAPSEVQEVREALNDAITKAGGLMFPVLPVTGGYCLTTGDQFGDAIARLAAKNPKLLASLSKSSSIMDYIAIGSWLAGLGVALGVEFGKIPHNSGAADVFGVTDVIETLGIEIEETDGSEPQPPTGGGISGPSVLGRSPGTPADIMAAG